MLKLNQLAELLVRRAAVNAALGLGARSIGQPRVIAVIVILCYNRIILVVKELDLMAWRAKTGFLFYFTILV
jgi:hypothetical protein